MAISILFSTSCKKVENDPFKRVQMKNLTPNTSVGPFSMIEFGDSASCEKEFSIIFNEKEILSSKFFQSNDGEKDHDIRCGFIRTDGQGLNIWALNVVSRPLFCHSFLLVRSDGKILQEEIPHTADWAGGQMYPTLEVQWDQNWTLKLECNLGDYEKYVSIDFK